MNTSLSSSIIFFTKYSRKGASSRYRSFQYFPFLEDAGFECSVSSLFDDRYLDDLYARGHVNWWYIAVAYFRRLSALCRVNRYDLLVIEKELFPYLPAWGERVLSWLGIPYVVDFDDAIFHQYDRHKKAVVRWILGNKISHVIALSKHTIVGNNYLALYAKKSGAKGVSIIPTAVDTNRYNAVPDTNHSMKKFTVGWIGSPTTTRYLESISAALKKFCEVKEFRVVALGATTLHMPGITSESRPWTEGTEIEELKRFDVGIMPLPCDPWTQGKCGLKLIQYMACGFPVVASPVGVNTEIVESGVNGFLAEDMASWVEALTHLAQNPSDARCLGMAGKDKVERLYSLNHTVPLMISLFTSLVKDR